MNAHEIVNLQTLENQTFALAARLHVILRREMGRVTDVEYMRQDSAYSRHVLDLIGSAEPEEVRALRAKLEELYFGEHGLFVKYAAAPLAPPQALALEVPAPAPVRQLPDRAASNERYIGRLR